MESLHSVFFYKINLPGGDKPHSRQAKKIRSYL